MLLIAPLSAALACGEDEPCAPAPERTVSLADLSSASVVLRGVDLTIVRGADVQGACPRLDAVQASAGTRLVGYGGSVCTPTGAPCRDIAFSMPLPGDGGARTLDLNDGTARIVVEAYPADPSWKLTGGEGRYARGDVVRFGYPFPAEMIAAADARLVASGGTDFVAGRVLASRVTPDALEVTISGDATPGAYRIALTVFLLPRFLRCEGVAGCAFDRPGDSPGTSVLRSLERSVDVEVIAAP